VAIINTTCLICLKSFTFETIRGGKPPGFCSKECKQKHNRKKNKEYNQTQKRKEYNLKLRREKRGYTKKTKKCLICEKEFTTFKKVKIHCSKECASKYKIQYLKKYYSRPDVRERVNHQQKINRAKLSPETKKKYEENNKNWRIKNKEKVRQNWVNWYLKPENKEKVRISANKPKRKETTRTYYRNRRKNDPQFKLINNLRTRLAHLISRNPKIIKNEKTRELIGCSVEELKLYIEKKFLVGMSWDNYNYETWHIDHIKPLSLAKNMDDIIRLKLMHYTNLQPLWAKDNIKKSNKYDKKI
jgi:hypothetical protein